MMMTFDFRFALMEEQELDMQRFLKKKLKKKKKKRKSGETNSIDKSTYVGKTLGCVGKILTSVSEGTVCISGESTSS